MSALSEARAIAAAVVLIGLVGFAGWAVHEHRRANTEHDAKVLAQDALKTADERLKRMAQADRITADVGAKAEKIRTEIRYVTQVQIREVPKYVTAETDQRYPLPWGLVRLHDAAALGLDPSALPNPAGQSDDAPSDVAASRGAIVIAENYGQCREDAARFAALQDWVRRQQKAWDAP